LTNIATGCTNQPNRKERKEKMTNQTITRDLRGPCGKGYERVSNWESKPASRSNASQRIRAASMDEQEDCRKRPSIWEILFTPPWRKNDGGRAGAEMPPFVVYMPGGSYTVTDSHRNLAAAAHAGPASSMAEVWQNTQR
jgi:hypothetical protein